MIFVIVILIISVSTCVVANSNNDSCLAITGPEYRCDQFIYSNCKNASLVVNKPQWDTCKQVELFWDAPMYNLTITFIPPRKFRQNNKQQSYQFCLEKDLTFCVEIFYRLRNGKEEKVKWTRELPACFKNQKGINSFTFIFQAGDSFICYGDFIRYSYKQL